MENEATSVYGRMRDCRSKPGDPSVTLACDCRDGRIVEIRDVELAERGYFANLSSLASHFGKLTKLRHPHIVSIREFAANARPPYIVQESVRGESLAGLLERKGRLSLEELLDCAWQVLQGLQAAHAAGVVHGALEPASIVLDAGGVYRVTDFGKRLCADGGDPSRSDALSPEDDLRALGRILRAAFHSESEAPPEQARAAVAWLGRLAGDSASDAFGSARAALKGMDEIPRAPMAAIAADAAASSSRGDPISRAAGGDKVRYSFRKKLVAALMLPSVLAVLVTGLVFRHYEVKWEVKRLQEDAGFAAEGGAMIAAPLFFGDHGPSERDWRIFDERMAFFVHKYPQLRSLALLYRQPGGGIGLRGCSDTLGNRLSFLMPEEIVGLRDGGDDSFLTGAYAALKLPGYEGISGAADSAERVIVDGRLAVRAWAPVSGDGQRLDGLVISVMGVKHVREKEKRIFLRFTALLILAVALSLILAVVLAYRVSLPIRELRRAARDAGRGDLDAVARVDTQDEHQVLADAFNESMALMREREIARRVADRFGAEQTAAHVFGGDRRGRAGLRIHHVAVLFVRVEGLDSLDSQERRKRAIDCLDGFMSESMEIFRQECAEAQLGKPFDFHAVFDARGDVVEAAERAVRAGLRIQQLFAGGCAGSLGDLRIACGVAVKSIPMATGRDARARRDTLQALIRQAESAVPRDADGVGVTETLADALRFVFRVGQRPGAAPRCIVTGPLHRADGAERADGEDSHGACST